MGVGLRESEFVFCFHSDGPPPLLIKRNLAKRYQVSSSRTRICPVLGRCQDVAELVEVKARRPRFRASCRTLSVLRWRWPGGPCAWPGRRWGSRRLPAFAARSRTEFAAGQRTGFGVWGASLRRACGNTPGKRMPAGRGCAAASTTATSRGLRDALELPGDRPLTELRDVPGEERAGEPVLKCLANDLAELAFDGGHGGIRELGRESFLHPVGASRFAAARGDRNDAVAVGPVGSWLTRLDLLRPLMAQKVEDHDGNAILHMSPLRAARSGISNPCPREL